jgi:nucleoside-diphosphate-sugar epimerase
LARILLIGCGDVGARLGTCLSEGNHEVFGVRRNPPRVKSFPYIALDIMERGALAQLPEADYLVYTVTPSERSAAAYENAYPRGVRNMLSHVAGSGLKRFFLVSSTSVYHQSRGEWVDESSETKPETFSGKCILEAERLALDSPVSSTVIRFGGIYGPGRNRLVTRVGAGCEAQKEPPLYTNRIHRDDCVGVLVHFIKMDMGGVEPGPCYLAVDSEPAPEWTVVNWLAARTGAPVPVEKRETSEQQNKRCSNRKLLESGYQLTYPDFRLGYDAVIGGGISE